MSNDDRLLGADDWFLNARRDWEQAEDRLEDNECADAAFLLQQSVEKYLKGYLTSQGHELKHTHDVGDLLEEVVQRNSEYDVFKNICKEISEYYYFEWSPSPSKVPSREKLEQLLQQTKDFVTKLVEETKL